MVHLHVHSMYSLRDSIIKPDDLIARLKEIGQTAVAITDHGSSLGGVSFYKILKENGIKYIHGCEMYVCDNLEEKDKTQKPYHLIVLCKNDVGRKNLNRLISLSNRRENMYSKPRIDFQMLKEYSDGLLVSSACIAGEVSRHLMQDDFQGAEMVVSKYKELFGEDYYLEIQSHNTADQVALNRKLVQLAQKMDVPLIVTSDAHHVWEQDRDYQVKYAFDGAYKEDGEGYVDCFMQSEDEVRERLSYLEPGCVEQMIANTHVVADKCNVEMPLSAPIMPTVTIPPEYTNSYEWLQSLCKDGFQTKLNINYDTKTLADPSKFEVRKLYDENWEEIGEERYQLSREEIQTYIDRYEYEMDSLHRMGFVDYILLVYSYANVATRRGIARGSGGGSLVCYLSNITDIDPIEHGLYFERFIDVGALSLLEKGEITAKELKIPDCCQMQ